MDLVLFLLFLPPRMIKGIKRFSGFEPVGTFSEAEVGEPLSLQVDNPIKSLLMITLTDDLLEKCKGLTLIWFFFVIPGLFISCKENTSANSEGRTEEATLNPPDSVHVVDVTAADYAFGMPSTIPSGWVTFRMKNMGQEEHLGIVSKFPDSISFTRLTGIVSGALETGDFDDFLPYLGLREEAYGGPAMLSPGLTGETTVYLEPGLYALTCWVKAPDGQIHLQKGMSRPFTVSQEASGADKPEGIIDIRLSNFNIQIEDSVSKGEQLINVHFENSHNLHLARLEEGQSLEDLKKWIKDIVAPAPFKFIGGTEPAPRGMTNSFKVTLEPGRYGLATYGYAQLGMATEFRVPQSGKAAVETEPQYEIRLDLGASENYRSEIPVGLTTITIENPLPEDYGYHFMALEDGKSVADVQAFYKDVFIHSSKDFFDEGIVS